MQQRVSGEYCANLSRCDCPVTQPETVARKTTDVKTLGTQLPDGLSREAANETQAEVLQSQESFDCALAQRGTVETNTVDVSGNVSGRQVKADRTGTTGTERTLGKALNRTATGPCPVTNRSVAATKSPPRVFISELPRKAANEQQSGSTAFASVTRPIYLPDIER